MQHHTHSLTRSERAKKKKKERCGGDAGGNIGRFLLSPISRSLIYPRCSRSLLFSLSLDFDIFLKFFSELFASFLLVSSYRPGGTRGPLAGRHSFSSYKYRRKPGRTFFLAAEQQHLFLPFHYLHHPTKTLSFPQKKMKFPSLIMMASAVVLVSSIYAHPALFKRAVQVGEVLACLAQIVLTGTLTAKCTTDFGTDVKLVQTGSVSLLDYDLSSASPKVSLSNAAVSLLAVPGVAFLPITQVALNLSYWNGASSLFSVVTPATAVVVKGNVLSLDIAATNLVVTVDQKPAFVQHLATLFTDAKTSYTFQGLTAATLDIKLPDAGSKSPVGGFISGATAAATAIASKIVQIPAVSVSSEVELSGFNNFVAVTVTRGQTFAVTTVGNTEQVRVEVTFQSPSSVAVHFGDVVLQVAEAAGTPGSLGTAAVSDFKLAPGENTFEFVISSTKVGDLGKVFSGSTTGLKLAVNGFIGSSPNDLANNAIAKVNFVIAF